MFNMVFILIHTALLVVVNTTSLFRLISRDVTNLSRYMSVKLSELYPDLTNQPSYSTHLMVGYFLISWFSISISSVTTSTHTAFIERHRFVNGVITVHTQHIFHVVTRTTQIGGKHNIFFFNVIILVVDRVINLYTRHSAKPIDFNYTVVAHTLFCFLYCVENRSHHHDL